MRVLEKFGFHGNPIAVVSCDRRFINDRLDYYDKFVECGFVGSPSEENQIKIENKIFENCRFSIMNEVEFKNCIFIGNNKFLKTTSFQNCKFDKIEAKHNFADCHFIEVFASDKESLERFIGRELINIRDEFFCAEFYDFTYRRAIINDLIEMKVKGLPKFFIVFRKELINQYLNHENLIEIFETP